jgi:hypothetical protein
MRELIDRKGGKEQFDKRQKTVAPDSRKRQ